mgnify:CR=1 FL=1
MSSNYVNGVSYPIFNIYTIGSIYRDGGTYVETIELSLCQQGGLTEAYREVFKRVELENNYKRDYDFSGAEIVFTLDYSPYVSKDDLLKIERLFYYNSLPDNYKVILTPRADALPRFFEVRLLDGVYSTGILPGGNNAPGNRLTVVQFVTVRPAGKNVIDVDQLATPLPFGKLNTAA